MVYLIKCDKTNTCKIGYASNPENRLSQLQTGNPFALELVGVVDGDISLERELHIKFDKYRIKGEWFEYSQEIKDFFDIDEFMMIYPDLLPIIMKMEQSEIRVYGYLLRYANGVSFSISKSLREQMGKEIDLNERTIYNTLIVLRDKKLLFFKDGLYQLNPRYAFRGSSADRNNALKAIIEIAMEENIKL